MPTEEISGQPGKTQAESILKFYRQLKPSFELPETIDIMNPFLEHRSWQLTELFYKKFYSDRKKRIFIFGINPGRFGGGVTGIPFTDPIRLENECGIKNDFKKQAELSSIFIYEVIKAYGGPRLFYGEFFITALSPLGYTKNNTNLNYYDDKKLLQNSQPFIVESILKQQHTIRSSQNCFCLGEGTNFKFFKKLNEKYKFFNEIIPLPHPRWIMQYRRKKLVEFTNYYVEKLKSIDI